MVVVSNVFLKGFLPGHEVFFDEIYSLEFLGELKAKAVIILHFPSLFSDCGIRVKTILENVRTADFNGTVYFVEDFLNFNDLCELNDHRVRTINLGLSSSFSIGNYYYARNPFGKSDLQLMNKGLSSFEDYILHGGLKVVFVDLDNTLIPGVFAEERSIVVKKYTNHQYYHYHYFKEFLIYLAKKGVAIIIVSKNDNETVNDALDTLCPDLKKVAVGISADYSSKSDRISHIIDKFNVNQRNCLFIDDNLVEIGEVSSALNVSCFHFDVNRLNELISNYSYVFSSYNSFTIDFYKSILGKIESVESLSHAQTDFSYNVFVNEIGHYDRVIELSVKTNQMNFNKFPLNVDILINSTLLTIDCTNENGYLGVVGYCVIVEEEAGLTLLQYVMSCRALGFGLERLFLKYIISEYNVKNFNFVETERNSVAKILFKEIMS